MYIVHAIQWRTIGWRSSQIFSVECTGRSPQQWTTLSQWMGCLRLPWGQPTAWWIGGAVVL